MGRDRRSRSVSKSEPLVALCELVGGRTKVENHLLLLHPGQPVVLLQSAFAAILKMFGLVSLMCV